MDEPIDTGDKLANALDGLAVEVDLPIKIVDGEGKYRDIEDIRLRTGAAGMRWIQIDISEPREEWV